jgi:PIN domain nuclease of toxin-antitoxin system
MEPTSQESKLRRKDEPVRLLAYTHVSLWALGEPSALPHAARDAIADASTRSMVSGVSLWECVIKASIGKLDLLEDLFDPIPEAGYEGMCIRISHLNVYRILAMHHRDPFDRMLVAQARAMALTLISRDPEITHYDVNVRR